MPIGLRIHCLHNLAVSRSRINCTGQVLVLVLSLGLGCSLRLLRLCLSLGLGHMSLEFVGSGLCLSLMLCLSLGLCQSPWWGLSLGRGLS